MDDQEEFETNSPATRLLDALGRGDLNALLLEFRPTTIVRTEDRTWSVQGEDEVLFWLEEAFERFPGLVFDSHARHIGYGQVIEEARVRDIGLPPAATGEGGEAGDADASAEGQSSPGGGSLVLGRDFGKSEGPQLNMPVRVTVLHDDAYVHEIIASYPRALLRAAMGQHVDPLDMAVSEIQSAFVAPAGSGFKTYQMGSKPTIETAYAAALPVPLARVAEDGPEPEPEPEPVDLEEALKASSWTPPPYVPDDEPDADEAGGRRRALLVVPLVMVLVAGDRRRHLVARPRRQRGHGGPERPHVPPRPPSKPTKKPSSGSPTVSPTKTPTKKPTEKPDVTFQSDLAFAINSAELSGAAKGAIAELADRIRAAELKGTIEVHGYTDNVGSASYALVLSLDRANAVKNYLRTSLGGYRITIKAFGHGETEPGGEQRHRGRVARRTDEWRSRSPTTSSRAPGRIGPVTTADPFRIGFVTGATPDKWARAWRERYPREPLELLTVTEGEQEALLRDGSLDMALVRLPVDREGLRAIVLYDEVPVVVASREHLVAAADEITLADLADEQLVTPHRSGWRPGGPAGLAGDDRTRSGRDRRRRHRHRHHADVGGASASPQGRGAASGHRPRSDHGRVWPGSSSVTTSARSGSWASYVVVPSAAAARTPTRP